MQKDSLGDRCKRYEAVSQYRLTPKIPVIVRVDGRAFHTFTKDLERPFDAELIDAMECAVEEVAAGMAGFKLAYLQSDEVSFLLTDTDRHETQGWFDYNLSKVISIAASAFTAAFNYWFADYHGSGEHPKAQFDARAFNVPENDVPNYFLWRQRDWERNSLSMLCQSIFSHKELQGLGRAEQHGLLHDAGVNWADLEPRLKNGGYLLEDKQTWLHSVPANYDAIRNLYAPTELATLLIEKQGGIVETYG